MRNGSKAFMALVTVVLVGFAPSRAAAEFYTVTDLGALPGIAWAGSQIVEYRISGVLP